MDKILGASSPIKTPQPPKPRDKHSQLFSTTAAKQVYLVNSIPYDCPTQTRAYNKQMINFNSNCPTIEKLGPLYSSEYYIVVCIQIIMETLILK